MNKEIKFRAYNKKEKKMYKCCGFLSGQVIVIDNNKIVGKDEKEFELMQFTGLLDKLGKEIYEGDIILFPYITPFGDIDEKTDGKIKVVKYKYGTFGFVTSTDFISIIQSFKKEEGDYIPNAGNITIYKEFIGKIIGDIYQNPELINL